MLVKRKTLGAGPGPATLWMPTSLMPASVASFSRPTLLCASTLASTMPFGLSAIACCSAALIPSAVPRPSMVVDFQPSLAAPSLTPRHQVAAVMSWARYSTQTTLWSEAGAGPEVGPYQWSVGPVARETTFSASAAFCAWAAPAPASVASASAAARDDRILRRYIA